ncbi:unnamed protein product [Tetraodon nigroviridis]|uniref:(spotted green pufferfish) hypothetical protein n=1 Tax=Tetraodon nigroviridis TaxID=99883 RepID=Q4RM82_TETNG|nr:unnamed protein product [Tetraodon nigroviridis]
MDGRYEEARLETKAATLAERLVVEWPLQPSPEASPPLPRACCLQDSCQQVEGRPDDRGSGI